MRLGWFIVSTRKSCGYRRVGSCLPAQTRTRSQDFRILTVHPPARSRRTARKRPGRKPDARGPDVDQRSDRLVIQAAGCAGDLPPLEP